MDRESGLKKKGLFIIFGEAFRIGGKFTRIRDTSDAIPLQGAASKSHMRLCEHLETKYNLNIDISFTTYTTLNYELLKSYYKPLKSEFVHSDLIGQESLLRNAMYNTDLDEYEFVFWFRFDMLWKDYFVEIFNPFNEKITLAAVCFIPCWREQYIHYPRVIDTMLLVPRKYFNVFSKQLFFVHEMIGYYITQNILQREDFDFILDTLHDSCTSWDYNPLYTLVSRNIEYIWHSYGWIFDKDTWIPKKWVDPIPYPDYVPF
jgi:hypothetical protein